MRISRDAWGIELAKVTARRGTCCRRQVGCVLVDADGHVIATGYNGVAAGRPHCNEVLLATNPKLQKEDGTWRQPEHWERQHVETYPNACAGAQSLSGTNLDGCEAIHAEQNALLQCRDVRAIYTAYVTCSPCVTCVKLLMNTGCQRIVFAEPYAHDQAARELWLSRNAQDRRAACYHEYSWTHYQGEKP